MFTWCSYCQRLLGEKPPLSDTRISHSLCSACEAAGEASADESIPIEQERLAFFKELFTAAHEGDLNTCVRFVQRGLDLGLAPGDLAFGALQPVLQEVGARWEAGTFSVADEHRVTRWCDTLLAQLPKPPRPDPPLDLLGVLAPSNIHVLGTTLAEHVLAERGFRVSSVVPAVPNQEVVELARSLEPRAISIACSLPNQALEALALERTLRAEGFEGALLVVGPAVRRAPEAWHDLPLYPCTTLWEVADLLRREQRKRRGPAADG